MDPRLADGTWRATVALVAGAFALIGAGFAGLSGSIPLAVALFALGGLLRLAVEYVPVRVLDEYDRLNVVPTLWLGPLVAGVVALAFLGATAGEVQALGGMVGLAGMVNYFLRPLYHLLYGLASRLATA